MKSAITGRVEAAMEATDCTNAERKAGSWVPGNCVRVTDQGGRIERYLGGDASDDDNWVVIKNTVFIQRVYNGSSIPFTMNGILIAAAGATAVDQWFDAQEILQIAYTADPAPEAAHIYIAEYSLSGSGSNWLPPLGSGANAFDDYDKLHTKIVWDANAGVGSGGNIANLVCLQDNQGPRAWVRLSFHQGTYSSIDWTV